MRTLLVGTGNLRPVAVEVVGGDGKTLHIVLALAGSAFVAIAAIAAAVVAARTANRRQQAQLDHDMEVRRREHIRDALDQAAERLYELFEALAVYELRVEEAEQARSAFRTAEDMQEIDDALLREAETLVDDAHRELETAREESVPKLLAVQASEFRLGLRIGRNHPTSVSYQKAKLGFGELRKALDSGRTRDRSDDENAECAKRDDESNAAYENFFVAAEAWNAAAPVVPQG
jgi:hypothetical protein